MTDLDGKSHREWVNHALCPNAPQRQLAHIYHDQIGWKQDVKAPSAVPSLALKNG
jgi:hypothetical protein